MSMAPGSLSVDAVKIMSLRFPEVQEKQNLKKLP
jgi:hypothetical protein